MNEFKFSNEDREMMIYGYDPGTLEYVGSETYLVQASTGLPRYCTHIPPQPYGENQTAIFNKETNGWDIVKDFRGTKMFTKHDGDEVIVTSPVPDEQLTDKPRPSEFHFWDGEDWKEDTDKKKAAILESRSITKHKYLNIAEQAITILERGEKFGILSDKEKESLVEWTKFQMDVFRFNVEDLTQELPTLPAF